MRVSALASVVCSLSMLSAPACEPAPAPSSRSGPASSPASTPAKPTASASPKSTTIPPTNRPGVPQVITEKDYTGVILPFDYPWSRGKKRWAPDAVAVAEAEYCIARELSKMAVSPAHQAAKLPLIVKELKAYRRQYLGFTDAQGRDMVWVNFFRAPEDQHADWTTSLVTVKGGGHGYFNVTADVAGGTCGELRINSPR
ncbi:MAG: hypothetical protein DRI90_03865 [Deltaproteobacteria bacterium]|nr:MAG: hypothetical protein DRI90_03865 [Deltaproteobacteria bacterium]